VGANAVEARNVCKYYRKYADRHKFLTIKSALVNRTLSAELSPGERFEALKDVSFDVSRGQTLGIIGENGSGKSTLLKILAGISRPTLGELTVDGRVSALIELGAGFHPEISGRENIFINGIILGLTRRQVQERYREIVEFAELQEFIDNPVKSYSSGMFMRLGFSIATNVDPDILLIDEVLAVGDATFVPKCLDKINEFRRRGKTIIFVSHDLSTVERICDEVIWMRQGKIETRGYPKRVVDAYLEYVGRKDEDQAAAQHRREEQANGGEREKRWGSRDVEIKNLRMFDAAGREVYAFTSSEPVQVSFDVSARAAQDDFVFGIGIYNTDGTHCYGSNTELEELSAEHLEGEGQVTLDIPSLGLVDGTYYLDVAVHKRDGFPFDYHHFQYTFRVHSGSHDVGVVRIPHTWRFSPSIRFRSREDR
jgi:ABC-type polysaccharide/polyol phosphate transport system ATPase subunit